MTSSLLIFYDSLFKDVVGSQASFDEFEISGSTYEPRGDVTLNGRKVDCSAYTSLTELAMICAMCNDSAVDYNVSKEAYEKIGEATETALVVLVEKMNVFGQDLNKLNKEIV